MECSDVCKVCPRLVISQAVTFDAGTLTINLPAGSYNNGEKYCIVVAQSIPAATTITAPVVLTGCNCAQLVSCQIRTRTRYAARVVTTATGGTFRLLGRASCAPSNALTAIDGTVPATT